MYSHVKAMLGFATYFKANNKYVHDLQDTALDRHAAKGP